MKSLNVLLIILMCFLFILVSTSAADSLEDRIDSLEPIIGHHPPSINGEVFNVGGGRPVSVSLAELTVLCRERTGKAITIDAVADTSAVDIPVYLSDTTRVEETTGWKPRRTATDIIDDIATWIEGDYERLRPLFVSA